MIGNACGSCRGKKGGRVMEKKNTRSILGSSTAVIAVMLCSRILGFLRQATIAGVFGACLETDIYFISSEFAVNVAGALSVALTTALITVYIAVAAEEGREKAGTLASRVLSLFLMMAALLLILLDAFAPQVGLALAPKYSDPGQRAELAKYLRLFSVTFLFTAFQSIYSAVLNANDIFVPGKLYGVVFNPIAIFAVLVLGDRLGVLALVYAYYVANIIQMFLLYFRARKHFSFRPSLNFRDPQLRQVLYLALPILLSNIVILLNDVIDKAICSYLGEGIASNYTYAHSLEQFVTGTFTATITLVLLSRFAGLAADGDDTGLEKLLRQAVSSMLLILAPVSLIAILCAGDIVTLVYLRGRFTAEDVRVTALALSGFSVGFPLVAFREIMIRVHFACQKTKWPMVISTVSVILNMILSVLLSRFLGIFGVTFATSVSAALATVLLVRSVKSMLPEYRFFSMGSSLPKCVMALVLCGMTAWGTGMLPVSAVLIRTLVRVLAGCAVYVLALLVLRCRELTELIAALRQRNKN